MSIASANDTELFGSLDSIWKETLNIAEYDSHDDFFKLGGDSIKFLIFIDKINRTFQLDLSLNEIFELATFEKIYGLITNKSSAKMSERILLLTDRVNNKLENIYLFPPVFGFPIIFNDLATRLRSRFNAYGVRYKGLPSGEAFDKSIEEMANDVVNEIIKFDNSSTYQLCGYSFGCHIAFEVSKKLETLGYDVIISLLDCLPLSNGINDQVDFASLNYLDNLMVQNKNLKIHEDLSQLKKLIGNNILLLKEYKTKGRLCCNINLFLTKDKMLSNRATWQRFTQKDESINEIPGDHYTLLNKEYLNKLSNLILRAHDGQ